MSILGFPVDGSPASTDYVAVEKSVGNRVFKTRQTPSDMIVTPTGGSADTLANLTAIPSALTATAAEINRVADVSTRVVSLTTATPTLTVADHEGKLITLNRATGDVWQVQARLQQSGTEATPFSSAA